jgi:glycosyltransferase involved in cell wall biosynthesis
MKPKPRISVVTSSYNQAAFIEQTIESVLAQNYSNLEHIVVDGMSTDDTPAILARYPHVRVIREPDNGQADAINKGFRVATGEIFGFLNSDDTFLPGALERVAREIDPACGRHVVMGRCRFIDEAGNFIGVEHPSAFESHRRVLEIWKGYCIPQPAVFWTREVWDRCGPLDERERLMLDYDLFCRFSKQYHFHTIDQVLATYRLQAQSKTSSVTDEQRLEQAIEVSRRYWGSPASAQYWQMRASYAAFRLDRRRRAVGWLRKGREAWRQSRRAQTIPYLAAGALLGPDVVTDVLVMPFVKPRVWKLLDKRSRVVARLRRLIKPPKPHPATLAWRDFTAMHADNWVGPVFQTEVDVAPGQNRLRLAGGTGGFRMPRPVEIGVYLDGVRIGRSRIGRGQSFEVAIPLGNVAPGRHELKIVSNTFVVPHDYMGVDDYRPLAFKLKELALASGS